MQYILLGFALLVVLAYMMRTKRFYFIRHGETILNSKRIRQDEDGSLSESGGKQSDEAGKFLMNYPIERIISSTYTRARETTNIINRNLKVPVIYSNLFVERKNPSEIIGKSTQDPDVVRAVEKIDLAYHDDDYRYSDEENFADLKKRAHKCVSLLSRQGARETVVVTHHHFLKMILAYMLHRSRLHYGDFVKLAYFNMSDNGGISVCEFRPWEMLSKTHGWKIISFNVTP